MLLNLNKPKIRAVIGDLIKVIGDRFRRQILVATCVVENHDGDRSNSLFRALPIEVSLLPVHTNQLPLQYIHQFTALD